MVLEKGELARSPSMRQDKSILYLTRLTIIL